MVRYEADVCCGDFGAGRRSMLGGQNSFHIPFVYIVYLIRRLRYPAMLGTPHNPPRLRCHTRGLNERDVFS